MKIAEDGEILMRGQGRMQGYYNKPEATAEAIDTEGWFHTGDIGELSPDGYLKITDRKKDLIVLTNGKKVAPQPIEATPETEPLYRRGRAVRRQTAARFRPCWFPISTSLPAWAKTQDMPTNDIAGLAALPEVQKLYKTEIEQNTRGLADYEKIKRFRVLDKPFSIETGELTPTLKVKRKEVVKKYADLIASMFRG